MMNTRRASLSSLAIAAALGTGLGYLIAVQAGSAQPQGPVENIGNDTASSSAQAKPLASPQASARSGATDLSSGGRRAGPQSADDVDWMLRDLQTLAGGDRRSFAQKLGDFLAEHPGSDGIAMASKGVFDLADNREVLPDRSLQAIYAEHRDPELRRVLAQVASMRGDNGLIESYIAEVGSGLHSTDAATRQQALVQLAKTRYAGAADMVLPLLRDENVEVAMNALLALRATGNQSHVRFVEELAGHPDESVSWLAMDVISQLQTLSRLARTNITGNELAAELPPVPVADTPSACAPGTGPAFAAR